MITESHMRMLQGELESLRDRMRLSRVKVDEVHTLHRMSERMLNDGRDGPFAPALTQINDLLSAIAAGLSGKQPMRQACDEIKRG